VIGEEKGEKESIDVRGETNLEPFALTATRGGKGAVFEGRGEEGRGSETVTLPAGGKPSGI